MTESLDSRKFERKAMFDVPLPIRRPQREVSTVPDEEFETGTQTSPNTMAFALMTKKGNRPQVSRTLSSIVWLAAAGASLPI